MAIVFNHAVILIFYAWKCQDLVSSSNLWIKLIDFNTLLFCENVPYALGYNFVNSLIKVLLVTSKSNWTNSTHNEIRLVEAIIYSLTKFYINISVTVVAVTN